MTRTLMVGFSEAFLRAVSPHVAPRSIVALEEPDVIRKRRLLEIACELPCLADVVPAEYQQSDAYFAAGLAACTDHGLDAILPGTEYGVPAAAALAEALGRPGAGVAAAATLRDKLRLRSTSAAAGVRNPEFRQVRGPDDIVTFAAGRPVVAKPADRQASVGVHRLHRVSRDEAATAWQAMRVATESKQVPDRPMTSRYLVETLLHGPEYSVEVLVREGTIVFENVTEKEVISGVHPVEAGHLLPAPLPAGARAELRDATRRLVRATGFSSGIMHAEWILTDEGPALIECAGRCPGDRIVDLIDLAYGTNLRLALIDVLAGRFPRLPQRATRSAAIRFLQPSPGTVTAVNGVDSARRAPGVHQLSVAVDVGCRVTRWRSSWDRPGYVIVTAADGERAQKAARWAAQAVQIGRASCRKECRSRWSPYH